MSHDSSRMEGGRETPVNLEDEAYWRSFRDRVLRAAGPELARRRAAAHRSPDLFEVLFAWRRRLAPAALAVAATALAALFLAADEGGEQASARVPPGVGLEDILIVAPAEDTGVDLRLRSENGMETEEVFAAMEETP